MIPELFQGELLLLGAARFPFGLSKLMYWTITLVSRSHYLAGGKYCRRWEYEIAKKRLEPKN
jgi:hypothetical protein